MRAGVKMDKNKKYLLATMFMALILRIVYVLTLEDRLYFPDCFYYYKIAVDLAEGKGYDSAFTTPLYPLFLSGIYRIFGDSYLSVRIIQSFVGTVSVLLIYLLGRDVFSRKVGLIGSFITAFYPIFIFFTGLLLTETLSILLLLSLIYLLQRMVATRKVSCAVGAGFAAGLCILIRPPIAYFLLLALFMIFIACRDKAQIINCGFLIIMLAGIVLSPWIIRNYRRFDRLIILSTGGGLTLYESNNPRATGGPGVENIIWTDEMREMNEIELDSYFKKEAINFILNHPKRFLKLAFIKFRRFWSLTPNAREYSSFFYKAISLASYGPILFLSIFGLIESRRVWRELILLYLPIISSLLLHLIILGSVRYRVPITPYLILFASYAIVVLIHRFRGAKNK